MALPKGQFDLGSFPRFGLTPFASRFPAEPERVHLRITGEVERSGDLSDALKTLPRLRHTGDFHCVTGWSCRGLAWEGYRFGDVFEAIVAKMRPANGVSHAIFACQDGYASCLPLADLMADDVLLADRLNGEPLSIGHGAPLRLVAPGHYGYKSAKHLKEIKLVSSADAFRSPRPGFLVHPRGRVAFEERGYGLPGWLLRYVYRPLIAPNIWWFAKAMARHRTTHAAHIPVVPEAGSNLREGGL